MDAAVVTGAGRGLGRATARRLAAEGYGVAVNCVAPGVMATPMNEELQSDPEAMAEQRERIPMGRLGDPGAVADAVAYLVDSRYVTGTRIAVDGGVSLVD